MATDIPHSCVAAEKEKCIRKQIAVLDSLRNNGMLPDAWISLYAYKLLVLCTSGNTAFFCHRVINKKAVTTPEIGADAAGDHYVTFYEVIDREECVMYKYRNPLAGYPRKIR